MISAKDFTKAEEGVKPPAPGFYLCIVRSAAGEAFLSQATYSQKDTLFSFDLSDQKIRHNIAYEIIGWVQIEEPINIAKQLMQR